MAGYYMIISKLNGTCLDVSRGGKEPGTKVISYKRNNGVNQLWYDHEATGTIRAKCNDLCIEIRGNQLVTNHYEAANMNQQWERQGNLIRNKMDHNTVIEILGADTLKDSATGTVGENSFNNGINQQWEFEHVGGIPPTSVATLGGAPTHADRSDEFYVVSEKNGKVLDISDVVKDKKTTLTMVVMHAKKYPPPKSQLWYTTKDGGLLYSSLNDTVFTSHGCGSLIMGPYKADKSLQWKIDGKKIVNGAGLCLDIRGDNDKEGAELCAYKYQGNHNQHWTFQTV